MRRSFGWRYVGLRFYRLISPSKQPIPGLFVRLMCLSNNADNVSRTVRLKCHRGIIVDANLFLFVNFFISCFIIFGILFAPISLTSLSQVDQSSNRSRVLTESGWFRTSQDGGTSWTLVWNPNFGLIREMVFLELNTSFRWIFQTGFSESVSSMGFEFNCFDYSSLKRSTKLNPLF